MASRTLLTSNLTGTPCTCARDYLGPSCRLGGPRGNPARSGSVGEDAVDAVRERDVTGGDTAGGVGHAAERERAPADVDVGVVVHLLGDLRDPVHHGDGGRETAQADGAHDRLGSTLPAVQHGDGTAYGIGIEQVSHASTLVPAGPRPGAGQQMS